MFGRKKRRHTQAHSEVPTNAPVGAEYAREVRPESFGGDYARDTHNGGLGDDYARDPLIASPPHGDPLVPRSSDSRFGLSERRRSYRGVGPRDFRRSDDRIREDICDRLCTAHEIDASDVSVHVADGEVTLTGRVDHPSDRRVAEAIADSCGGVRHVENLLNVGIAQRRVQIGKAWE